VGQPPKAQMPWFKKACWANDESLPGDSESAEMEPAIRGAEGERMPQG